MQKLFNAGCTVGLGTDGAASNNDLDLFGEMRTAGLVGKLKAQSASAVDSHSIVRMATLGGARALGYTSLPRLYLLCYPSCSLVCITEPFLVYLLLILWGLSSWLGTTEHVETTICLL